MKISVVVPALNEAGHIADCLQSVVNQPGNVEIIVADGGSQDETCEIASRYGQVILATRGRATQMNEGAACASGEVLLFLHADSHLHPQALAALDQMMSDREVMGGTFTLQFDQPHSILRFYALASRLKWRLLHYGDQGIYIRKSVFREMGGFKEIPLMEDIDLLLRLRRFGRVALLHYPVTTSARRFLDKGIIRQELLNILLVGLYLVGISPHRLAKLYRAKGSVIPK